MQRELALCLASTQISDFPWTSIPTSQYHAINVLQKQIRKTTPSTYLVNYISALITMLSCMICSYKQVVATHLCKRLNLQSLTVAYGVKLAEVGKWEGMDCGLGEGMQPGVEEGRQTSQRLVVVPG